MRKELPKALARHDPDCRYEVFVNDVNGYADITKKLERKIAYTVAIDVLPEWLLSIIGILNVVSDAHNQGEIPGAYRVYGRYVIMKGYGKAKVA